MVDSGKITEKAAGLAGQAVTAAGPMAENLKEKANELAEQAAAAAGPLKDKAEELLDKAGGLAAQGVSAAAEGLDKVTGGKFSGPISSVSSKIEDRLDPSDDKPSDDDAS